MTEYGEQKLFYLAYHNSNIDLASLLVINLTIAGFDIWYDRFEIMPNAVWEQELRQNLVSCENALVLLSKDYVESSYGKAELQQLNQQNTRLYLLILDDITLDNIINLQQNLDIFDFQNWHQEVQYESALKRLLACFHDDFSATHTISIAQHRIYQMISIVELRLQNTFTGLAALESVFHTTQNISIRPRGYEIQNILENGHYFFQEISHVDTLEMLHRSELRVENLLECMVHFQTTILAGKKGTGKSYLLYLIFLEFLHRSLIQGASVPYPLYIHLLEWDRQEPLSDFIHKRAQQHHTESHYALFLDGLETVTDANHRIQVSGLLNISTAETIVAICDWDTLVSYQSLSIPIIRLPSWSEEQTLRLAKSMMETTEANHFIDKLYQQSDSIYPVAHISFKLLKHFGIDQSLQKRFRHVDDETWFAIRKKLAYLAFTLYDADYERFAPHTFIQQTLEDNSLFEDFIHVGILEQHGTFIGFTSQLLQNYFAAQHLMLEGLYTRLQHPQFDEQHTRQSNIWDSVIMMLLELLPDNEAIWHIESIAEIDPFLALDCIRYCEITDTKLLRLTLEKVMDSRRKWSRMTGTILGELEAIEDTLLYLPLLLEMLCDRDWAKRQLALELILVLDTKLSKAFTVALSGLERSFPELVFILVEEYGEVQSIVWLLHLSLNDSEAISTKAIWSLGELREHAAVLLCLMLLDVTNPSIVIETLYALGKIGDETVTGKVLRMCQHDNPDILGAAIRTLNLLNRPITARLISFLIAANEGITETFLQILANTSEKDIKNIIKALLTQESIPQLVEGQNDMNGLLQLLSDKFNTLRNQSAFNNFVEDITSLINDPDNKGDKQRTKQLKQRIQSLSTRQAISETEEDIADAHAIIDTDGNLPQKLLLALKHDNWLIRLKTVHELIAFPSDKALPLLIDAAQDDDSQVRTAAVEYLGKLNDYPITIDILLNALDDTEYLVTDAATDSLKQRGSGIVYGLLRKLNTDRVETLAAVINILGYVGDESVVEHILPYLDNVQTPWLNERTLSDITAQTLITIGSPNALEALQKFGYMNLSTNDTIILPGSDGHSANKASADLSPNEKLAILLKALHSSKWERSQKAARYLREYAKKLRKLKDENIRHQLVEALTDANWVVRWTVAEALAWLHDRNAIPYLEATLNDSNWIVQVAVINALVELKAKNSVDSLTTLLSDENQAVREASVEAISILGDEKALIYLEQALQDEDDFVRLAAVHGITSYNNTRAISLLTQVLEDKYSHIRWFAIKRLAEISDEKLIPYFATRLGDNDGPGWENLSISDYALQGLKNVDTPHSEEILRLWDSRSGDRENGDDL